MVYLKTEEEIAKIRESSLLVGKTLGEVARHIKPGITTLELDKIAEEFIRDHNAVPGFKGYNGFPGSLCTSRNEEVVHGIPNNVALEEGDILSVDCGVFMNGFFGDSAYTFEIGTVSDKIKNLLAVTKDCLKLGVEQAVAGNRVGDIGYAVQKFAEDNGYGVVRELVGHGVGRDLHEKPEVPNYGRRGTGSKMSEGLVIAIEPMINMGKRGVTQAKDGWTIITKDKLPSAHYEHTVAVMKGKPMILSSFEFVEEILGNN